MKLSAFVAAAAVIGGSFLIPVPSDASVFVELNAGLRVEVDDTNDTVVIKKGSQSRVMRYVSAAYKPIPASVSQQIRSELRTRGVRSFSTGNSGNRVQRVGITGGGNIYTMRGIDSGIRNTLNSQFAHLDTVNVGHWTVYSLVQ